MVAGARGEGERRRGGGGDSERRAASERETKQRGPAPHEQMRP